MQKEQNIFLIKQKEWKTMIIEWAQFLKDGINLNKKRASITVGVFDGVHLGHRELIKKVVSYNPDNISIAFTFKEMPGNIQPFEEKAKMLLDLGINIIIVIDFNDSFRHISGNDFLEILLRNIDIGFFAAGDDFRCGFCRNTDAKAIKEYYALNSIPVEIVPQVMEGDSPISSSRIRSCINAGEIELAERMLGRKL